jgi:two-component system CheB/CheR fusion protein
VRDRVGGVITGIVRDSAESIATRLRDAGFEAGGEPQVVVSRAGLLVLANERARTMFDIVRTDIGRPIQDIELSYRPAELRSLIERCYAERAPVAMRQVKWRGQRTNGEVWLDVEVSPLADAEGSAIGATVVFKDVTAVLQLHQELEQSKQNLETAYEELQSTNEELETTNEELQSTVEELETTNEELQSTNEELETMNEELHSTNEELQTMNDELRRRGIELNELNDFLGAVFSSMRGAVVVLDREMRVLVWNSQSEELWGLRAAEVEQANFFGLDIGFPVDQLAGRIRGALQGTVEEDKPLIEGRDRRGRSVICRVTCVPLRAETSVRGVIVTMEAVDVEVGQDGTGGVAAGMR